jgi:pimeloyl-ACP methyl ester carboxylesterase
MQKDAALALSVLNGVLGDHLHRTANGLATELSLVGEVTRGAKVVVLAYGLMCTEDVWAMESGDDYGSLLARDFGYEPLYLRYNTGRPVGENGEELSRLLEDLVARIDPREILFVGFSMGGLVIRSACHLGRAQAHRWVARVRRAFYLGTPHLGSPWERAGRVLTRVLRAVPDPYTRLAADLGDLRSRGIKDLGDACEAYPLLPSIRHHLVAGFLDERFAERFGDALVPLASGTDGACADPGARPPAHVKILPGVAHLELAHHPQVYEHIRAWCAEEENAS